MNRTRIAIPRRVLRALRDVEALPATDMCDRETAIMLTEALGHDDASEWMALHRHLYFQALGRARASRGAGFANAH
jgi:hypothetical protein